MTTRNPNPMGLLRKLSSFLKSLFGWGASMRSSGTKGKSPVSTGASSKSASQTEKNKMLYKSLEEFKRAGIPWVWPNFSPEEFVCKCGGRHCDGEYYHDEEFLTSLQTVRTELGIPFVINSGHRCAGWNAAVGGAPGSMHKKIAADISLLRHDRFKLRDTLKKHGFTGFGYYKSFIHADRRATPASWYGRGARPYWA